MSRFPRLPQYLFRIPRGYKKPRVEDFKADMQRLGEDIAQNFLDLVINNIQENTYNYTLNPNTVKLKGSATPLIDTGELISAIFRDGTIVSVESTNRSDSGLTNLQLAIVLEYGIKDKGVPARPVWRDTYRDYKEDARARIEHFLKSGKF